MESMMKRKCVFAAILLTISSLALTQELTQQGAVDLSKHGDVVLDKNSLSNEQRKALWNGTTSDVDGYFRIESNLDTIELPQQAAKFAKQVDVPAAYTSTIKRFVDQGYPYQGLIEEAANHYTFIFGGPDDKVMYTVWDYKSSGVTMTRAEEFLNVKVNNFPGIITLLVNKSTDKVLWKVTWVGDGVSHELYISDKKNSRGVPIQNSLSILKFSESL